MAPLGSGAGRGERHGQRGDRLGATGPRHRSTGRGDEVGERGADALGVDVRLGVVTAEDEVQLDPVRDVEGAAATTGRCRPGVPVHRRR